MKKKIILGFAVLAIAAVAAFNVNLNTNQKSDMSLLALANVEALAQNENGGKSYRCIYGAVYGGIMPAKLCESCVWQFFLAGYSSVGTCVKS